MDTRWFLIVSASLFIAACGQKPAETATVDKPESRVIPVTATTAATADVPVMLEAVGEVQSVASPAVSAELPGRITELRVDVGDRVRKGDLLARLDSSARALERDAAQAEQRRLQALLANQESLVRRYHDLAQSSFVAQNTIDEAEAQLTALRAELEAAGARAALADDQINKSAIVAPVAGTVDKRMVAVGDYVKDGAALFKLADGGALRLTMVFPEPALGQLRVGTPLKVVTAVDPTLTLNATITELRPVVESANKGVVAYADLKEPEKSRAGASAAVRAIVAVHKGAAVVPQLSLVRRPAGEMVYVIGPDNKAVQRRVVSGVRLDDGIEIIEGVSVGERIAVDGAGFLTDGVSVEIKQR